MQPPRMPRAIRSIRWGKDGPLEPSEEVKPQWHLDFRLWLLELCENKFSWFWVPKFMVVCYSDPGNLYSSQSCSLVPEHFLQHLYSPIPPAASFPPRLSPDPHSSLLVAPLPSASPPPSQDHYLCKMSGWGLPWRSSSWESGCLPRQETQFQFLVQEDSICHGATQLVGHNYGAREPQLLSLRATTTEAQASRACALQQEKPLRWKARSPQWRVAQLTTTRESPHVATKTQCSQNK